MSRARRACPETCREKATDTPDRQYGEHARHPRVDQDLPGPAASRARQGELADGEQIPLMRLRYGGSAHRWGTAIYAASKDSYEDQIWFSGSTEEIFDLVCDLHVTNAGD
jgi:hypothetical protein